MDEKADIKSEDAEKQEKEKEKEKPKEEIKKKNLDKELLQACSINNFVVVTFP